MIYRAFYGYCSTEFPNKQVIRSKVCRSYNEAKDYLQSLKKDCKFQVGSNSYKANLYGFIKLDNEIFPVIGDLSEIKYNRFSIWNDKYK